MPGKKTPPNIKAPAPLKYQRAATLMNTETG